MSAVKAFLARRPVAAYFLLTFAVSWGGVFLAIGGPAGMTGVKAQENPVFPWAVLGMVAGPSLSCLVLTVLIDGRQGLRALGARLLEWRVSARWYAVALLAAPILSTAVTSTLSRFSPEFFPGLSVSGDKTALVLLGLAVGLAAGIFEEIGWTGFAVPRLTRRYGVLTTGLIVGLLWSAWHGLVVAWGMGNRAGTIPLPVFMIVDGLAGLPAFRVLMVWVYDRTGSLFVSILMHVSITACTIILTPQATGAFLLTYGLAFAAAVWVVVAAVAMVNSGHLTRQPFRRARWA